MKLGVVRELFKCRRSVVFSNYNNVPKMYIVMENLAKNKSILGQLEILNQYFSKFALAILCILSINIETVVDFGGLSSSFNFHSLLSLKQEANSQARTALTSFF